jgi:LysR family transcriptional regulator, low CO2-responsive transcriptional regulator
MRTPSLRQLRAFVEVARAAGIGRAAQVLHLTQPAVSMQIRDLEAAIGLPLFDRAGKGMRLTTTGEYFLVYARRIFATLKEAEDTIARLRGLEGGRVVIGMVSTADHFLPRLLARFRTEHPGVEIRLSVGNREQLVQALHGNEVDLAVMGRPPESLAARAEPFAAHPLGVVASAAHPLARRRGLAPAVLAQQPFIVREPGSGTRAAMQQFFTERHVVPTVTMEMTSNETIKQAVLADMGLAFLSLHTVAQEIAARQLAVLDVEGLPVMRRWHIVSLQARLLSPAAEAFRYFVLEEGERLLATLFGKWAPATAAHAPAPA